MRGIVIKNAPEQPDRSSHQSIAALLFLVTGIYGILLFMRSLNIMYQGWLVYPLTLLLCCCVWYTFFCRRSQFYVLVVLTIACCALAVWWSGPLLWEQALQIAGNLSSTAGQKPVAVTESILLLTALLVYILFLLEFVIHNHVVIYILTTEMLLVPPLLGIQTGIAPIVLLALFQMTFWTIHSMGTDHGRLQLSGTRGYRLSEKSSIAMGLIVAVLLLASVLFVSGYSQDLYDLVYEAEGQVQQILEEISGRADELTADGTISRGNNYQTGTPHLELQLMEKPTENLYLRGFSGGTYVGGSWIHSDDETLLIEVASELDWGRWYTINKTYYNMYFDLNSGMETENGPKSRVLTIQHSSGEYDNTYIPYYSAYSLGEGGRPADTDSGLNGYVCNYYEQKDMVIDWDQLAPWYKWYGYRRLQEAYMKKTRSAYTQVPKEILPRLTKLAQENPLQDLDEISTFILYTLDSNADYTLTPGQAPLNQDIVEYFMFESGKGYCEHFAAAATLLYRLYGIPARYASGYVALPSDFKEQADGTYRAVLSDTAAHAWTEIFLENYGWTPVEVTPAEDGTVTAVYPGFDDGVLKKIMREHNWNMVISSLAEKRAGNSMDAERIRTATVDFSFNLKDHMAVLLAAGIILACLFCLFLRYRRLRLLSRMEVMSCRKVFLRLMQMLHFGGYLSGYDGTEEDFAARMAAEIPSLSEGAVRQMQAVVSEAAFGSRTIDAEEEKQVRELYKVCADWVYQRLKRGRRFLFRYWKVYG